MDTLTLRPVAATEQAQAISLWNNVFNETSGFFERYYSDADPGYRDGDTLGAWSGERLVSAVHLCRRPTVWGSETLLCGGIANVATLPDFRRQGLSRRLLEMAIVHMEGEGFHFSLLGTGVHGHYSALGWEQTRAPRVTIQLNPEVGLAERSWRRLDTMDGLPELYAEQPRPLQFVRPDAYFDEWVGWNWRRSPKQVLEMPERGYIVLDIPEEPDLIVNATEWRAADTETEQQLLRAAAGESLRRGHTHLSLDALPQYLEEGFLHALGAVSAYWEEGAMTRNIAMPEDQYRRLVQEYHAGNAVWWPGDGF